MICWLVCHALLCTLGVSCLVGLFSVHLFVHLSLKWQLLAAMKVTVGQPSTWVSCQKHLTFYKTVSNPEVLNKGGTYIGNRRKQSGRPSWRMIGEGDIRGWVPAQWGLQGSDLNLLQQLTVLSAGCLSRSPLVRHTGSFSQPASDALDLQHFKVSSQRSTQPLPWKPNSVIWLDKPHDYVIQLCNTLGTNWHWMSCVCVSGFHIKLPTGGPA